METSDLQKRLLEEFIYVDGNVYKKIGCDSSGYSVAGIDGKRYGIHQLVFLMHHGFLPQHVDHIDGNKLNNKIENLRAATPMQNQMNARLSKKNKSGVKGVHWSNHSSKWMVRVRHEGKRFYLGSYEDFELAELVSIEFRTKHHGEFARHK